ncbi:amino acid/amide ABC transporter membrane protein 2, HAAT family [Desulfacinum hydrothermale DSM 13146]|uniref:Amino acid/amide ABC transporter membrane protein 2, HAAT family n=1 Tax=Desulfacinum hydrothermale DSM 13146 TaxID=1121390 RepID=A0A1W1XBC0_9BACT|nr:branched-chain amino acid ABC transporter permease [Desulfacinum hydrothermale]SMC21335.1 amino acid/amide ABC transporter membrane protein 2, HAAT family [Desulfacinum hydrothermale DSM 13146]
MSARGFSGSVIATLVLLALLLLGPCILPIYWTMIVTEIFIMGLFSMSFNLLFGFSGLLSFGQAGFFGIGAYTAALLIQTGFPSLWLIIFCSVLVAALFALAIGYLCVRRDEIFFAMLTLGFGMMLFTIAHNWRELTGGSDGMPLCSVPPVRLPGIEWSLFPPVHVYYFTLFWTAAGVFILWRVVRSPFGLMLTAVRENKQRLAFVGADVSRIRLAAFVIAGGLAGLAGVLFCVFNRMATPDFMHWAFSARPVLMTILGGSGVFFGPAWGAAIFFCLEQLVTAFTENWMIVLGLILIPVVIFFPQGIVGTLVQWLGDRKESRS